MRTHAEFDVIEVVEDGGSYPMLLGIGWASDIMEVINFKNRVMMFENQDRHLKSVRSNLLLFSFEVLISK